LNVFSWSLLSDCPALAFMQGHRISASILHIHISAKHPYAHTTSREYNL
jgi:hypothetical protein